MKKLIALMLCILLLSSCSSAPAKQAEAPAKEAAAATETAAPETAPAETAAAETAEAGTETAEASSAAETSSPDSYEELYSYTVEQLKAGEITVIYDCDISDQFDRLSADLMNNPELYWITSYSMTRYTGIGTVTCELVVTSAYSARSEKSAELEAKAAEILSGIPADADDYEKSKYIHDYLITHITYDGETSSNNGQDIYAALVEGHCVCAGYAAAYQYLMTKLGIPCGRIFSVENESHVWNWTELDGERCYTDVTWDDQETFTSSGSEVIFYNYLNLSLSEMSVDHTPMEGTEDLEEGSDSHSYFVRENAVADSYSISFMSDIFSREAAEGACLLTFRCSTEDCYQAYVDGISNSNDIFTALEQAGIEVDSLNWCPIEESRIIAVLCE